MALFLNPSLNPNIRLINQSNNSNMIDLFLSMNNGARIETCQVQFRRKGSIYKSQKTSVKTRIREIYYH